jgi:Zinc finger, C3HC4 type (RING finger)
VVPDNCCSFVLCRGKRKGLRCQKDVTYSMLLNKTIPSCELHREKYEAFEMTARERSHRAQSFFGSYTEEEVDEEERVTESVSVAGPILAEEDEVIIPSTTPSISATSLPLSSIPKAIERSFECCICLEDHNPLLLPCGHTVCFQCVTKLKTHTCPLCREHFSFDKIRRL